MTMRVETLAIGTIPQGRIPDARKLVVRVARPDGYAPSQGEIYQALQSALAAMTPVGQVLPVTGQK